MTGTPHSGFNIRLLAHTDVEWAVNLCLAAYGPMVEDVAGLRGWLTSLVDNHQALPIRTDGALAVTLMGAYPWQSRLRAEIVLVTGPVWECVSLCRYSIKWARALGAAGMCLGDSAGSAICALAKRIGLTSSFSVYRS